MENMFDDILDVLTPTAPLATQEKKKKNYVIIALDESGSMSTMWDEAIEMFNSQVIEARNTTSMDNRICLILFSDKAKVKMWDVDAKDVRLLDRNSYHPDGFTAMLDSVGIGISKLLQQPDIDDEDTSVLFIVISDGYENASKEYTYSSIAEMINTVSKTNRWTFAYLGASDLDLKNVKEMGIPVNNTMAFVASAGGMSTATQTTLNSTRSFLSARSKGATYSSSFYNDATSKDKSKDETVA